MLNDIDKNPGWHKDKFSCPSCEKYCAQEWVDFKQGQARKRFSGTFIFAVACSVCSNCSERVVWLGRTTIRPAYHSIEIIHINTPSQAAELYYEAASIFELSPRSSASLLRAALQIIFDSLGVLGVDKSNDLATLKALGVTNEIIGECSDANVLASPPLQTSDVLLGNSRDDALRLFLIFSQLSLIIYKDHHLPTPITV